MLVVQVCKISHQQVDMFLRRSLSTLVRKEQQPHYKLTFTCTHAQCARSPSEPRSSTRLVSKTAYDQGVVLVRCECDKLHLIADRLGWFAEGGTDIEQILREKGEQVVKEKEYVQVDNAKTGITS
jgi:hypothetical protein